MLISVQELFRVRVVENTVEDSGSVRSYQIIAYRKSQISATNH